MNIEHILKKIATARVDARGNFKGLRGYFIYKETQRLKQLLSERQSSRT